jgi:nitrogen fixation NifU-like protein
VDHFLHPRNAGLMPDPDGVGEDEFAGCGDLARFFLRVRDGRVSEARFQTYGCGPTIAAASVASEWACRRGLDEVMDVKAEVIERALDGLPDDRKHAAEVAAGALRAAARDCRARRG